MNQKEEHAEREEQIKKKSAKSEPRKTRRVS
jgi:hypothetical protein